MQGRVEIWAARLVLPLLFAGAFTGAVAGAAGAAAAAGPARATGVATPAPPMGDMPGMDHGSGDMPQATPSSPSSRHGRGKPSDTAATTAPTTAPTMDPGMDMDHGSTGKPAPDRPLAPVLGAFGAGTTAVLFSAALLRRKDRAARLARAARRASRSKP